MKDNPIVYPVKGGQWCADFGGQRVIVATEDAAEEAVADYQAAYPDPSGLI